MQALTLAISPSGIEYLTQQIVAHQIGTALSQLVPSDTNVPISTFAIGVGTAVYTYSDFNISLSGGSLANFSATFQSLTQNENGQFTLVMGASNVTVKYSSWKETYNYFESSDGYISPTYPGSGGPWPYSMGISTLTFTVPVTLAQQPGSYTLTVGQVTATASGYSPNIPSGSQLATTNNFVTAPTVNDATLAPLDTINLQTSIQNTLSGLVLTIPASGKLTPNIVFNFNAGDTPLTFPPNNAGMSLGVTGNVTWQGQAYSGGTQPSLPMPSLPTSNHVHFYAADYEFNELYWAFYKDGRLNTTITSGNLPDPGVLNTSHYEHGSLSPLYNAYKDLEMSVGVTPQSPPTVTFQSVYQLVYGDNGVLTTQEVGLPLNIYTQLGALGPGPSGSAQGSVYLTQADYETALEGALSPGWDTYKQQIEQASLVSGPFSQLYQVTQTGLSSLQTNPNLPSGVYTLLSSGLTVGQVFVDKAWLLVAVENALSSPSITNPGELTNQYAAIIEAAFAVQGSYPQVYWVTPGTNGPLSTLVEQLPPDVYNDILPLENNVYLDQTDFTNALYNAIGSAASKYTNQITSVAGVVGAITTHTVQAVIYVKKAGQWISAFTMDVTETDLQQNFRLSIGPNNTQTVQFDFQILDNETSATLVSWNIPKEYGPPPDEPTFADMWSVLEIVYVEEMQKMGHSGVPLPFMAGFQFLFEQATVAVQPGYVDVLANVEYKAPPAFTEALTREPGTVDLFSLLRQGAVAAEEPRPRREPARWGGSSRAAGLSRTRTTATKTRLVRSTAASGSSTGHKQVQEGV